jgi:hypothetical protein
LLSPAYVFAKDEDSDGGSERARAESAGTRLRRAASASFLASPLSASKLRSITVDFEVVTGEHATFSLPGLLPSNTIHDVKCKIAKSQGLEAFRQRLMFRNVALEDSKMLSDYGIVADGCTVRLGTCLFSQLVEKDMSGKRFSFELSPHFWQVQETPPPPRTADGSGGSGSDGGIPYLQLEKGDFILQSPDAAATDHRCVGYKIDGDGTRGLFDREYVVRALPSQVEMRINLVSLQIDPLAFHESGGMLSASSPASVGGAATDSKGGDEQDGSRIENEGSGSNDVFIQICWVKKVAGRSHDNSNTPAATDMVHSHSVRARVAPEMLVGGCLVMEIEWDQLRFSETLHMIRKILQSTDHQQIKALKNRYSQRIQQIQELKEATASRLKELVQEARDKVEQDKLERLQNAAAKEAAALAAAESGYSGSGSGSGEEDDVTTVTAEDDREVLLSSSAGSTTDLVPPSSSPAAHGAVLLPSAEAAKADVDGSMTYNFLMMLEQKVEDALRVDGDGGAEVVSEYVDDEEAAMEGGAVAGTPPSEELQRADNRLADFLASIQVCCNGMSLLAEYFVLEYPCWLNILYWNIPTD